jgi:DNA mismatch endonuclease (patch repair protein)
VRATRAFQNARFALEIACTPDQPNFGCCGFELMTDRISKAQRSRNMQAIRSTDTEPELTVRRIVHGLGYRYRLHSKQIPGRPDLVFPARRKVIFVHGCFWHAHPGCVNARLPASNREYWVPKLQRNIERDRQAIERLRIDGWKALVIWECEARNRNRIRKIVTTFLR